MTDKMAILREHLGDFREYIFTGLIFTDDDGWSYYWKRPTFRLSQFEVKNLPEVLTRCPCTTPIIKNCLIMHIPTGRLEFVGSTCMYHFHMNKRKCVECYIAIGNCKSNRCTNCRKLCKLHKEYHDDNAVHEPPVIVQPRIFTLVPSRSNRTANEGYGGYEEVIRPIKNICCKIVTLKSNRVANEVCDGYSEVIQTRTAISRNIVTLKAVRTENEGYEVLEERSEVIQPIKPFLDRPLSRGKHAFTSPNELLGDDDGYLLWLFKSNYLSDAEKTKLATLLPDITIQFGKHKHNRTFGWIKANDVSYYNWIKANVSEPFVAHL